MKRSRTLRPKSWLAGVALLAWAGGLLLPAHAPGLLLRFSGILVLALWAARRRSLTPWIFWSMLAGIEYGLDLPHAALSTRVFSDIFLRLIKSIVAPLIFGTLVTGIAGHGSPETTGIAGHDSPQTEGQTDRNLGRLGWRSLLYFEVLTTIALAIGLLAINLSQAGAGVKFHDGTTSTEPVPSRAPAQPPAPRAIQSSATQAAPSQAPGPQTAPRQIAPTQAPLTRITAQPTPIAPAQPLGTWQDFLLRVFPDNIAQAVATNQILEVAVFALLFGLALNRVPGPQRLPMLRLVESLTQTMFAFTNLVMYLAPLAVGAALAFTVASAGPGALASLGKLLLTLYLALAAFAVFAMLPAALLFRVPVRAFLKAVAEPATIAFATSTSEAALPRAMESMEAFGVPRRITGFVIPAGYSFNLAGSALYLAVASIFVAQAAGRHLGWREQAGMLLVLMLTSKGVAGVPRAVLVVLLATAGAFHLPEGPIFLILGIDALLDMGRTVINVTGNCLAAAVLAKWEGAFRSEPPAPETILPANT